VEPEDVVNVLRKMLAALAPGGIVLDLQVIRPDPRVECEGRLVCEIDGERVWRRADAATAALDALLAAGELVEEARDDHDVCEHYPNGAHLVEDFEGTSQRIPEEAIPVVRALGQPCIVRERCRLRRLRLEACAPDDA
jgi:hypothetical protein